jgi:hypothetical protein
MPSLNPVLQNDPRINLVMPINIVHSYPLNQWNITGPSLSLEATKSLIREEIRLYGMDHHHSAGSFSTDQDKLQQQQKIARRRNIQTTPQNQ